MAPQEQNETLIFVAFFTFEVNGDNLFLHFIYLKLFNSETVKGVCRHSE